MEQVGEGATAKGNAPACFARARDFCLCADAPCLEIAHQFVDAGYLKVLAEDDPDPFSFVLDDRELAVFEFVTEGEGA